MMIMMMGMRVFSFTNSKFRNFTTKPKYPHNSETKINWTDEQKNIISEVKSGRAVFITGSAGTGKTLLLDEITRELKMVHGPSRVFVTASTGVAAYAIRGQTLHSFAGVGILIGGEKMLSRVRSDEWSLRRWNEVEALIIDDISMIGAHFFDDLEFIARKIRKVDKVWGGIQLVVSGDFFQLPPITYNSSGKEFAFEADCWDSSFDSKFQLTEVFRQKDPRLIKLLESIRRGENDPEVMVLLQDCTETKFDSSVVQLYLWNNDVKKVNDEEMRVLAKEKKELFIYQAADSFKNDVWKSQLKHTRAPRKLKLHEGARVMLTKNLNPFKQPVNGATGTVIGFAEPQQCPDLEEINIADICDKSELPVVRFDSGRVMVIKPELWCIKEGDSVVAQRKQVPLTLAWALSIHKCQGKTLDKVRVDLSKAFGYGMVYVALSRVISLDGLHLSSFDPSKIMAHPKVLKFYQSLGNEKDDKVEEEADGGSSCSNMIGSSNKSS